MKKDGMNRGNIKIYLLVEFIKCIDGDLVSEAK